LAQHNLSEADYANTGNWATYEGYSPAERVALEFTEKFATSHLELDDAFFARFRQHYTDDEIMEIMLSVGTWMSLGRITMLAGVKVSCALVLDLAEAPSA